ncbi:MAG: hypothetical protein ACREFL_03520 [Stellaceae bacterium]
MPQRGMQFSTQGQSATPELALGGDAPRPVDTLVRRVIRPWCRKLARSAESVIAAAPFGENLSEEEFAFCLLLIAAH